MSSKTLLIFIFALIATGPPRFFGGGDLDAAFRPNVVLGADYLIQIIAWGLAGLVAAFVATDKWFKSRGVVLPGNLRQGPARWYLFYAIVCVASAAYSAAPAYTLFFASKILISILVVSLLLESRVSQPSEVRVLKVFGYVYATGFVVLVGMYLLDPTLVGFHAGVTGNYRLIGGPLGGYGTEALVAGIFALVYIRYYSSSTRGRVFAAMVYGLTWVFLVMSLTRSSIFLGALALLVIGFMGKMSPVRLGMLLLTAALFSFINFTAWGGGVFSNALNYVTRGMIGLDTLSGRTTVAEYLLGVWREAPILGHGYASGSRLALIEFVDSTGIGMGSAHGSLWKSLIEVGVVGASLMIVAYILAWHQTIRLLLRHAGSAPAELVGKLGLIGMVSATFSMFLSDGFADGSLRYIILMLVVYTVNRRLDLEKNGLKRLLRHDLTGVGQGQTRSWTRF